MANKNRVADIMKQFEDMDTEDKTEDIEFIFGANSSENKQLEGLKSIQTNLDPNLLENHPDNSFSVSDDPEYIALRTAIKEYGITNPIICYKSNDKYIILSGHRRTKAAKELNLKKVPVRIIDEPQKIGWNKFDELVFLGTENLSSRKQKPIDIARFSKNLIDELKKLEKENGITISGRKRDYVAEKIPNLNSRMIGNYLKLLNLPKNFQQWTGDWINLKNAMILVEINDSNMFDDEMFILSNEIKRIINENISEEEKKNQIDKKINILIKEYERVNKKPKRKNEVKKKNIKTEIKNLNNKIKTLNENDFIIPKKISEQEKILTQIKEIKNNLECIENEILMSKLK